MTPPAIIPALWGGPDPAAARAPEDVLVAVEGLSTVKLPLELGSEPGTFVGEVDVCVPLEKLEDVVLAGLDAGALDDNEELVVLR